MKILFISFLISTSVFAVAAAKRDKRETMMMKEMSAQQHQDLAKIHQRMSDCLKTTTSQESCQNDMIASCQEMLGEKYCRMIQMTAKK